MKATSILLIVVGVFAFYSFNTSNAGKDKGEGIQFFQASKTVKEFAGQHIELMVVST